LFQAQDKAYAYCAVYTAIMCGDVT